jgi:hypothetical protein
MMIKSSKMITTILLSGFILALSAMAQPPQISWKRQTDTAVRPLQLFHSIQTLNLPTTETMQKGEVHFEISHRFATPVSAGIGELYGMDGSVIMRIGLGYAVTDNLLLLLARSNRDGNIDFQVKQRLFDFDNELLPVVTALHAGIAYNGKPLPDIDDNNRKFQYYAGLIINGMLMKKLGIGLYPNYLYNSHIYCPDVHYSFTMSAYAQYYVDDLWSVIAEVTPTVTGWRNKYNSVALGIEFETGGHFFKFSLGNSSHMNPSQYLAGARDSFDSGDLHIGFNITRLLK